MAITKDELTKLKNGAKALLPVEKTFDLLGLAPKSPKTCPSCENEGSFFFKDHLWFGCMRPSCDFSQERFKEITGTSRDAIGAVAFVKKLDFQQACLEFIRMAGLITEEQINELTAPKKEEPKPAAKKARKKKAKPPLDPLDTEQEEEESPLRGDAKRPIFQAIYGQIPLKDFHRGELRAKRGFTDKTIKAMGFKSSYRTNKEIINQLRKDYTDDDLVDQRVLRKNKEGMLFPEDQLCGRGNTGRKDDEGNEIWDDTNPVLIPYFNRHEEVFWIRPHKGGLKGRKGSLLERDKATHVYGEHIIKKLKGKNTLMITEGEFKAAAAFQCGIPCIALPGIQMANSEHIWSELVSLIHRYWFDNIVICFDNEDKSHKEPEHQHDVVIWALVLARKLRHHARSVKIAMLPNTERDEDGKADLDGILSRYVNQLGEEAGTEKARQLFRRVMNEARPERKWLEIDELIPTRAQRIILTRVNRYTTTRCVPIGGDEESKKSWLFRRNPEYRDLAEAFDSVRGVYYTRKNLPKPDAEEIQDRLIDRRQQLAELETANGSRRQMDRVALDIEYCRELLRGRPHPIANFSMQCLHRIKWEDGRYEFYVKAFIPSSNRNVCGVVTPNQLNRAATFREFSLSRFAATFGSTKGGGDQDLQGITTDLNWESEFMEIHRVEAYGYHEKTGYWFFADACYRPDGSVILPDDQLVFWDDHFGYQIEDNPERTGQHFTMGAPFVMAATEPENLAETWHLYCDDMAKIIGGLDAWGAMGTILAYYAMPDFFKRFGKAHPGLWFYGLLGGGKTQIARSLMCLSGFKDCQEFRITPDTTPVGMGRALAQYSFLPMWFDEYRREYVDATRDAVFRGSFDRSSVAKGRMDQSTRTYSMASKTTPFVTGETMSIDPATRSRYYHCQISSRRRDADPGDKRYLRILESSDWLSSVPRFILQHQKEFLDAFYRWYEDFKSMALTKPFRNKRIELVHAVAFSGFMATSEILKDPLTRSKEFFDYMHDYAHGAQDEIESETLITSFWEYLVSHVRTGEVRTKNFKVLHLVEAPDGSGWKDTEVPTANSVEVLAINATDAFNELMTALARQRINLPIGRMNLAKDISREKYWIKRNTDGRLATRIRINGALCYGWLIRTDTFEYADVLKDAIKEQADVGSPDGLE